MLSALFSSLAESFRAQLFDDPSASAQAAHFDALADAERTQEAFQHIDMSNHSSSMFDHSSAFDHSSSFDSGSSFGSGSSFD